MTLCNMAVEMGAKNGIIAPDETTAEFLAGKIKKMPDIKALQSDKDAEYERTVEFDVSKLEPQVACPSQLTTLNQSSEIGNVPIDQAFIGSCTNGRLEDLRIAAQVMKGKKVKDGVRALVIPASQEVWKQANEEGLLQIFTEAGAIVCGSAMRTLLRRPHRLISSRRNMRFNKQPQLHRQNGQHPSQRLLSFTCHGRSLSISWQNRYQPLEVKA